MLKDINELSREWLVGFLTCFYAVNGLYKKDSLEGMDKQTLFELYKVHSDGVFKEYRKVR